MPAGQQIAFKEAFALVFAEHRINDAAGACQKLVIVDDPRIPLPVGDFKDRTELVLQRLVGAEDTEVSWFHVGSRDIA